MDVPTTPVQTVSCVSTLIFFEPSRCSQTFQVYEVEQPAKPLAPLVEEVIKEIIVQREVTPAPLVVAADRVSIRFS